LHEIKNIDLQFNRSPSTASQKFFPGQLQRHVVGLGKILWLAVIRGALSKKIAIKQLIIQFGEKIFGASKKIAFDFCE